jgi:hypothetical protein
MALKVMVAGCPAEEKERAESDVRRALGPRVQSEAWMVSLVKMQGRWSITLDGPGARARTCVASEGKVSESIREALQGLPGGPGAAAAPASAPAAATSATGKPGAVPTKTGPAAGPQRDRHTCGKCNKPFTVSYESQADESQERAAVACPHCWAMNHVLISESAAENHDYRAEKA